MTYLFWKLLHVVAVVAFLGNITTGLFWAAHANRSRNFNLIGSTFEGIIRSDQWFTIPGVVGILAGGFGAAIDGSIPILGTGWIFWPIVLFSISGIVFAIRVAPLQRKILNLARAQSMSDASWQSYRQMYRSWEAWGLLALLTPVAALVIMILKPSLPAL